MPWVKVDQNLYHHPKVIEAGNRLAAMQVPTTHGATPRGRVCNVWLRAMCYHNNVLTDGFISEVVAREILLEADSDPLTVLAAMEAPRRRGLVARVPTGWQFVNYEEYQPTKAEVEKKRQKAQRRMQKARAARSRNVRANKSERAEVFTRTDQVRSERVRVTRSDPDRSHLEDQDQNLPALRAGTFQQALENPSSLSPASSPHADARVQATLSDRLEHAGDGADRRLRVGDAHQAAGGRAGVRPVSEAAPDDRRDAGGGTRAWPDAPAASPSEACGAAARVPVVAADVAGGVGVGAELHDPRDRRAALSTARTLSELTALSDTFRIGPKRTKGAA